MYFTRSQHFHQAPHSGRGALRRGSERGLFSKKSVQNISNFVKFQKDVGGFRDFSQPFRALQVFNTLAPVHIRFFSFSRASSVFSNSPGSSTPITIFSENCIQVGWQAQALQNAVKCIFVLLQPVPIQMSTSQGTTCGGISDSTVLFNLFFFLFFISSFFFSPSFRVRPPRTVFLLGFPRTVRPSRAVSILLGRLFSALLCSRRAGQHALPQSTVGGRHRPCVSHGSKPAVATESLPNGLVSISPTVSVE